MLELFTLHVDCCYCIHLSSLRHLLVNFIPEEETKTTCTVYLPHLVTLSKFIGESRQRIVADI